MFPLSRMQEAFVKVGTLTVIDADGETHVFGGSRPGPAVTMRISDASLYRKLFFNPDDYIIGHIHRAVEQAASEAANTSFFHICKSPLQWRDEDSRAGVVATRRNERACYRDGPAKRGRSCDPPRHDTGKQTPAMIWQFCRFSRDS